MEDLSIIQSTLVVEMTEKGPDFSVLVDDVTQKEIIACRETLSQAKWVPHILASYMCDPLNRPYRPEITIEIRPKSW